MGRSGEVWGDLGNFDVFDADFWGTKGNFSPKNQKLWGTKRNFVAFVQKYPYPAVICRSRSALPEKKPSSALEALAAEQPSSLMQRLRAVWPTVERALQAGHSLRAIHKSLNESGLTITYRRFTVYRARIERANNSQSAKPLKPGSSLKGNQEPPANEPIKEESQEVDPLVNVRKQMKNRVTWEYPSGPPDEKKLI
jgi:hypothetical protein